MKQYRFYLEDIDDNTKYELKHDCGGWADYGVNYGRETKISNVVKSYTDGWDFYKEDADWIKQRFYAYGPNRRLRLVVEHLKNALKGEYEVAYRGYLDLTQIEIGMSSVNLPTMESGFFKALENKWSEEYEIDYDTYCKINGNVFSEKAEFNSSDSLSGTIPTIHESEYAYFFVGGEIKNKDSLSDKMFQSTNLAPIIEGQLNADVYSGMYNPTIVGNSSAMMVIDRTKIKELSLVWNLDFSLYYKGFGAIDNSCDHLKSNVSLYVVTSEFDITFNKNIDQSKQVWNLVQSFNVDSSKIVGTGLNNKHCRIVSKLQGSSVLKDIGFDDKSYGVYLILAVRYGEQIKQNGESLMLYATSYSGGTYDAAFVNSYMSVGYEIELNNKAVSTIKSTSLFERLIDSINNGEYNVYCDLSDFRKVAENDLITSNSGMKRKLKDYPAGEDTRDPRLLAWNLQPEGWKGKRDITITGNIKTSLQSFLDYCYAVYNYQLAVDYDMQSDKYRVYLAHFDNMYDGQKQIAKLGGINDVSMQIWREVLYSKIEIGYEVSEESINVDREFNCKYTFGTPNTEIEESTLQLVSPYSASTRDFETELYLHYNDEDDDSNDNVYVIAAKFWKTYIDGREFYEIDRSIEVEEGSLFPTYEWNVKFSPKRMLLAHARELFSYLAFNVGSDIEFSLCDHNSELVADGIKENGNVEIGGNILFRPLVVSVASKGDVDYIKAIDANRLGYISFMYKGREVRGFLAKDSGAVNIKPMREQRSEYRLLLAANSEFRI